MRTGLEKSTLDVVIAEFEKVNSKWLNAQNQLEYCDFRDALEYLKEYRDLLRETSTFENVRC